MGISKVAVLLTGFQQQGKLCQLLGASVDVNTSEVVTEDVFNGLTTAVAFKNIEVIEHIKTLIEDVTRARCKVGKLQLLQVIIVKDVLFGSRLTWLNKVLPVLLDIFLVGIVVKIDTSDGVLYHVLHYPVGREDLCCCRNVLGFGFLALLE